MRYKPVPAYLRAWRATRTFFTTRRPRLERVIQVALVAAVPVSLVYAPVPAAVLIWALGLTFVGGVLLNVPLAAVRMVAMFLHMGALAAFEAARMKLGGEPWLWWQPGLILTAGLAAGYHPTKYALSRFLSSPQAPLAVRDAFDALTYDEDESTFPSIRRRQLPQRTRLGLYS